MSAISVDDDDDAEFQADLARAIAASLEPDLPGGHDEGPRSDAPGWKALLAADQETNWASKGVNAGRCSPALLAVEDEDVDFQRQIAAAMAASIQSAEEDRRRREIGSSGGVRAGNLPPTVLLSVHGPAYGPQQTPDSLVARPPPPPLSLPQQRPQLQGFPSSVVSVCCSSGLVLKPLAAAARESNVAAPDPSNPGTGLAPTPWSSSVEVLDTAALAQHPQKPMEIAGASGDMKAEDGAPQVRSCPIPALVPTPACSPCSSAGDSAAPVRPFVAPHITDLGQVHAELERASGGTGRGGTGQLLLSSSPGKHARTPSLARAIDSAQPQMKRSRPASDSGTGALSLPGEVLGCPDALARHEAACYPQLLLQPEPAKANTVTWVAATAAGEGDCGRGASGSERAAAPVSTLAHTPPERPDSAASCCTASAVCGARDVSDDGDCLAAAKSSGPPANASVERQSRAFPKAGSGPVEGEGAAMGLDAAPSQPRLSQLSEQELQQRPGYQDKRHVSGNGVRSAAAAGGRYSGGQESASGSYGSYALNLSAGSRSPSHMRQQQEQLSELHKCVVPNASWKAPGSKKSGVYDMGNQQERQQHAVPVQRCGNSDGGGGRTSLAPLDLSRSRSRSRSGSGSALGGAPQSLRDSKAQPGLNLLRWPHDPQAAADATAVTSVCRVIKESAATTAATAGGSPASDPMMSDSPPLQPPQVETSAVAEVPTAAAAADVGGGPCAGGLAPCWGYSGTDRRMLLHQRVWWWLGPGQAQSGRISSIDRRSEPLLYSVRLDSIGGTGAEDHQTIIATADSLFPYLSHGDRLMCRLPLSVSMYGFVGSPRRGSGSVAAAAALQQPQQLEEWPEYGPGGQTGANPGRGMDTDTGPAGVAMEACGSCVWMCGTLQHCIFDRRVPMVHVLLGPEEVPYSTPYEFVVPVVDAAEGSGCCVSAPVLNLEAAQPNTCTEIVPVGPAA